MDYCIQHKSEVEKQELFPVKSSQRGNLAASKTSDEDHVLGRTSTSLVSEPQQGTGRGGVVHQSPWLVLFTLEEQESELWLKDGRACRGPVRP